MVRDEKRRWFRPDVRSYPSGHQRRSQSTLCRARFRQVRVSDIPAAFLSKDQKEKSRLAAAFSGSWQEPAQQLLLDGRGSGLGSVDRSASGSLGGIASSLGRVNRSAGSRGSGSSSRSGSSSSARCSSDSAGSGGSSSVSGRSSSRSRCRGSGGSRCRGRSGFFLLAASGKSGGSDQGGQDERLVHDEFPLIGQNEGGIGKTVATASRCSKRAPPLQAIYST
jgi:hypothetical protein